MGFVKKIALVDCHAEPVEVWRAGLCALPFDGAQGDSLLFQFPPPREGCGWIVLWQGGMSVMQAYMAMKPLPQGRNRTWPGFLSSLGLLLKVLK